MECLDVLTDSPKWYHKKHVENSVEKKKKMKRNTEKGKYYLDKYLPSNINTIYVILCHCSVL